MTLDQILQLMAQRDMTKLLNHLDAYILIQNKFKDAEQYHPELHKVMFNAHRPDKIIEVSADDPSGREGASKAVKVARLALSMQKKIVMFAAAFLGKADIECTPAGDVETQMLSIIEQICETGFLDYKWGDIAEITMSERHCAELWYTQDVDESYWGSLPIDSDVTLSMQIIANSLGDNLYPVFDQFNKMIAFGRQYFVRELVGEQVLPVSHFDVYTADYLYYSKNLNNTWLFLSAPGGEYVEEFVQLKNIIGKIPVIYYFKKQVEWSDVQTLIERLETKISNHADTNDYFDSPIVVATGQVEGFAEKGNQGKLLQMENGATVDYLTWDNAPASMKLEIDNLKYFIGSLSHTPDLTFESIQGLGKLSGIAIRLLFLDADLKAERNEPIFAQPLQRRYNWLKTAISILDSKYKAALNMKIKPIFKEFLDQDPSTVITTLNAAVAGGILSSETAIDQNPLVTDPDAEKLRIKTEIAQSQADAIALAQATTPQPTDALPAAGY